MRRGIACLPILAALAGLIGGACGLGDRPETTEPDPLPTGTLQLAASSTEYPGPCLHERCAPGTPVYLSADYHGLNPATAVIGLPDWGRFRLGISCVATGFVIIRIGPDSAVCTKLGKCTEAQLATLTESQIDWVRTYYPQEVPFYHICQKHGFGWYDAVTVRPGYYLAIANSVSAIWGLVDGHGTMDTYAYYGNGGVYQPVGCSSPCSGKTCGQLDEFGQTCCRNGCDNKCTPVTCSTCRKPNACGSACVINAGGCCGNDCCGYCTSSGSCDRSGCYGGCGPYYCY